ncbi:MAG TPA: D-alanyl-D-alanine carboxypeptidase/D-alanyl-D-alanine-endopeptidase [Pseudobdellovibrionaceae bacterium]|nr:D-alanyl-D-alanine carboxypeptidase/D-alanyl-D-alanine-endopeptidase [Pseudobdellovibrionaceae bacterium]
MISTSAFGAKSPASDLRKRLEAKIQASGVPAANMSLYITSGEEGDQIILDVNSKKGLIPASISKVATASAALEVFPPGHKFKTSLWVDGDLKDGVLKGRLILLGGGDPSFVSENMWFLVNQFLRSGIKKIDGDILVDDSLFDDVRYDESREDSRVDRAYDAPVGAMSFNWNSVNVFTRPAAAPGKPALVFLDPENGYTKLVNKTVTVAGSVRDIKVERKSGQGAAGDTLIVSGRIGTKSDEIVVFKNITKPDLWSGENLKSFLAQRNVEVTGKVLAGKLPKKAEKAAEAESKSIELVIADMNKFSNNYVAEMLTKNMAAMDAKPAGLAKGVQRINRHLKDLGLPEEQLAFKNPSGLTRDNRLSAFAMWKVLNHLKTDFRVQPEFLMSLPISGVDGTLKSRMKSPKAQRWVRAKTGLLTGVTALAGYAGREDGKVFTFVFIHNGPQEGSRMRSLFDDWLTSLID